MLMTADQRLVQTSGHAASRAFTMKPTAHLMRVLSGMYSNIPWAIVREYGTNMLDGYTRLKRDHPDVPFRAPIIHLPNTLEPYISFTDFGIGMDYDTVWNVFAEYGASTKRENNDEVGGLGLGSKTAFCYEGADGWTIEGRKDGQKHIFHSVLDTEGMPTLLHVLSEASTEPSGVTIKISVRPADFALFREATEKLYTYFPIDLQVVGNPDFKPVKPSYFLQGTDWAISRDRGQSFCVMGNVPYPLDPAVLSRQTKFGSDFHTTLSVALTVPIGAVDITPSREALRYTPRTLTALNAAYDRLVKEARGLAEAAVKDAPTAWDALVQLHTAYQVPGLRASLAGIRWKTVPLDLTRGFQWKAAEVTAALPDARITHYSNDSNKRSTLSLVFPTQGTLLPGQLHWIYLLDVTPAASTKLGLTETQLLRRVKYDMAQKLGIGMSNSRWNIKVGSAMVFANVSEAQVRSTLWGHPVLKVSELSDPPVQAAGPAATRTPTKVKRYSGQTYEPWQDTDVVIEDGGTYLRLDNGILLDRPARLPGDIRAAAITLGVLNEQTPLLGLPRTHKRLEGKDGWIDLWPLLTAKLAERVAAEAADVARANAYAQVFPHETHLLGVLHALPARVLQPLPPANALATAFGDHARARTRSTETGLALLKVGIAREHAEAVDAAYVRELQADWAAFRAACPMLVAIAKYLMPASLKDADLLAGVTQYLQSVAVAP